MMNRYIPIEKSNPSNDTFNDINVVIIHGVDGFPEKSWYGWMARKLQTQGCRVVVPQLPTNVPQDGNDLMYGGKTSEKLNSYKDQTLDEWNTVLKPIMNGLDPAKTVVIGHSLGGAMAVHLAHQTALKEKQLLGLFCICPVAGDIQLPECEPGLSSFYTPMTPEFIKKAKEGAKNRTVIMSNNDPDVPPEQSVKIASFLKADTSVIPGAGHINSDTGFDPIKGFPFLLGKVTGLIDDALRAKKRPSTTFRPPKNRPSIK